MASIPSGWPKAMRRKRPASPIENVNPRHRDQPQSQLRKAGWYCDICVCRAPSRGSRPAWQWGGAASRDLAMKYDLFISHSSEDAGTALALVADFENRNIACWVAPATPTVMRCAIARSGSCSTVFQSMLRR